MVTTTAGASVPFPLPFPALPHLHRFHDVNLTLGLRSVLRLLKLWGVLLLLLGRSLGVTLGLRLPLPDVTCPPT